jgi:hypothetical protein
MIHQDLIAASLPSGVDARDVTAPLKSSHSQGGACLTLVGCRCEDLPPDFVNMLGIQPQEPTPGGAREYDLVAVYNSTDHDLALLVKPETARALVDGVKEGAHMLDCTMASLSSQDAMYLGGNLGGPSPTIGNARHRATSPLQSAAEAAGWSIVKIDGPDMDEPMVRVAVHEFDVPDLPGCLWFTLGEWRAFQAGARENEFDDLITDRCDPRLQLVERVPGFQHEPTSVGAASKVDRVSLTR